MKRPAAILLLTVAALAQRQQRGVEVPSGPSRPPVTNGSFDALVIGINRYAHWPQLKTAVNDARAIEETLRLRYGFRTRLLVDAEATRANIMSAFGRYRTELHPNDNLLVYYAGHGTRDGNEAYWLPVDSGPDYANWIIARDITNFTVTSPARHILIVSDSCYSGGLTRSIPARPMPGFESARSRVLIASGRDEPVSDSGSGGHSVFANALLTGLNRLSGQSFTAMTLFDQYVKRLTVGNSEQVPRYDTIQNSGDEGGDFFFVPRSGVLAGGGPGNVNPPVDRQPQPPPAPKPPPSRPTTTRLAPDGRSAQAPPLLSPDYLPLTPYRADLLMARDVPQTVTDAVLVELAQQQVGTEQGVWFLIDDDMTKNAAQHALNPQRPKFVFEWQKYADENPALAKSLLNVFLRPDADWSFLKKEKGWDENYDAYVAVFLFAREKIQGRQTEFVARELLPVLKRHLQAAVAQAPAKLWFELPVTIDYDFNLSAIRFKRQGHQEFADTLDLADPVKDFTFDPIQKDARNTPQWLPPAARTTANYRVIPGADLPLAKPGIGVHGVLSQSDPRTDPADAWRHNLPGSWRGAFPAMTTAALDRQLKLTSLPLDARRAEQLGPALHAVSRARVYVNVDHMDVGDWIYEHKEQRFGVLFAKVQRIDIISFKDQVIGTIPASALPAAGK